MVDTKENFNLGLKGLKIFLENPWVIIKEEIHNHTQFLTSIMPSTFPASA